MQSTEGRLGLGLGLVIVLHCPGPGICCLILSSVVIFTLGSTLSF